jgi:hypothetical protein
VTLVELIVIFFWLGCGAALAVRLGTEFGIVGGIIGFFLGVGLSFGVSQMLVLIEQWQRRRWPLYPVCANGVCGPEDYIPRRSELGGSVLVCRCGTEYMKLRRPLRGYEFNILRPDGALIRYMRRRPFGSWRPEDGLQRRGGPYRDAT